MGLALKQYKERLRKQSHLRLIKNQGNKEEERTVKKVVIIFENSIFWIFQAQVKKHIEPNQSECVNYSRYWNIK